MLVLMKVKDGSQVLATGVLLVLERPGSEDVRRFVHIRINYGCAVVPAVVTAVAEALHVSSWDLPINVSIDRKRRPFPDRGQAIAMPPDGA